MKLKAIFMTIGSTVAMMSLVFSLFFNSILGAFGLAVTSVEKLRNLTASQAVVEKMKTRNKTKKAKVSKRFVKKSSKRALTGASAAVLPGAAVLTVAAVMVAIEGADYCDEKASLQEEENILFGTQKEFDMKQCAEEAEEDAKLIMAEVKESSTETVSSALENIKTYSSEKWEAAKAATIESVEELDETTARIWRGVGDSAITD